MNAVAQTLTRHAGAASELPRVSLRCSLRTRIVFIVVLSLCALAFLLANHLLDQFEEATRIGVLHEGLLISNLIESSVAEMAERKDAKGIQQYLNRLVSIRSRNDIEMNVLFLHGDRSAIVASNVPDNIEAADEEEHRELLIATARRRAYILIETEDSDVDADDPRQVGPNHPDFYFSPGYRLLNITTPLMVNGRGLGSVNIKLSLRDLDMQVEAVHDRVTLSIVVAITALIVVVISFLEFALFNPLSHIAQCLRQFGHGVRDFNPQWRDRRDEIGVLAQEFSRMVKHLNEAEASNRQYQKHLKRLVMDRTSELAATQEATILSMASLAEFRDPETGAHLRRTQNYIKILAGHLKLLPKFRAFFDTETIEMIFKSAPLHDIGKVGIPDAILLKLGPLTEEEFERMKEHPAYGRDAITAAERNLGTNSFLRFAREIAYTHHEKWDGTGYPQGLAGDEIPISGRLMAIADVYDALISRRCYKLPFEHSRAVEIIRDGRGRHFDPDMVDAFLELEDSFRQIAYEFAESVEEREAVSLPMRIAA